MRRLMIGLILVVLLLTMVACAAKAPAPSPAPAPAPAPESPGRISFPSFDTPAPMPTPMPTPTPKPAPAPPSAGGADQSWDGDTERMIVRTGNISLVVNDVLIAIDEITKLSDGFEGYVVSSSSWQEGERLVGTITIRVLAEHFDDAMRALRGLAVEVTQETTSSKDVTEEYIDLSASLRNLEATEEQLLRLMEKAVTVQEILEVQRELSQTRSDIERTKGRMQYLERTSATSLIEIRLEQAKLDVNFTASGRNVKTGQDVRFGGQIAGGFEPYSYEWDFGDGNTSTLAVPFHAYKTPGSYTVSLEVTDDRGNTDIETRDDYITVLPGWSAGNIASAAWNGLVTFGQVLTDILIWVGIFSPVWIVIGVIILFWRRRKKKA